ncbi:MAG: hypothetical protein COU71_00270 [Parcubacteria group bacterium CG10_big_fil_rev_8_21_14_0_10_38_31]|nr:MAG: hypothetical protein COU71_00270 [Parcubacteria group bacterium CG10_big_fil_rev_8_21_14_0_10_38_31]
MNTRDWPVFSKKELVIGNLNADVGVCTLWSPRDVFVKRHLDGLMMDKIAVVGNLYSVYGLGILVRNYLANPHLKYLIVTGTMLGNSKEAISALQPDSPLASKMFLEPSQISRFLRQVKIVFVDTLEVKEFIKRGDFRDVLRDTTEFEPLFVELPEPKSKVFPSSFSGHLIRARTIDEGYGKLLKEIREFGHITGEDSEGHKRQELWQLTMVITDQYPCDFNSVPHPEYDVGYIEKYCKDLWEGTESEDISYRYGHIIRHGFGNQIKIVVRALKQKSETFRAVISLWAPHVYGGSVSMNDPPCIMTVHFRLTCRRLHMWTYIRTNDMFNAWSLNVAALRYFQGEMLQAVRDELKDKEIQLGELTVTSGSAHVYERDWLKIDTFLSKVKPEKFFPDPKGNFEIRVEDKEIVVRHFSPIGELLQIFHGDNAEKLSHQVAPFISDSKNALYVGRELQKAEEVLRNKTPEVV